MVSEMKKKRKLLSARTASGNIEVLTGKYDDMEIPVAEASSTVRNSDLVTAFFLQGEHQSHSRVLRVALPVEARRHGSARANLYCRLLNGAVCSFFFHSFYTTMPIEQYAVNYLWRQNLH